MAIDVGMVSAVGAGALSFLSPCVLPLVPPYLCYMAGVSVEEFRARQADSLSARKALMRVALAFVLGFSSVFIALGVGASTIFLRAGRSLSRRRVLLRLLCPLCRRLPRASWARGKADRCRARDCGRVLPHRRRGGCVLLAAGNLSRSGPTWLSASWMACK